MQQQLFSQPDSASLAGKIVKIRKADASLSKEQQAFNRLVKRISNLQSQLKQDAERLEILSSAYQNEIIPRGMELSSLKIQFCQLLDAKRQTIKLSNSLNIKLDDLILDFLEDALAVTEPDELSERLYKKYSGESYIESSKEIEEEAKDLFCDMIYRQFGLNINPADITDNPDYEKIQADLEDQLKKKTASKQNSRSGTKKQQDKERIEQRKHELKSKTLRSIYLSLVKLLHPDGELDEELKKEKEEMMKQVTIAYNNRDMMCLLQLEMQYVTAHQKGISEMDNESLKLYLQLLKDQVKDLEEEREIFFMQPAFLLLSEYWQTSLHVAMGDIKDRASEYQQSNDSIRNDIEEIQKTTRTYAVIRDCIRKYYEVPGAAW